MSNNNDFSSLINTDLLQTFGEGTIVPINHKVNALEDAEVATEAGANGFRYYNGDLQYKNVTYEAVTPVGDENPSEEGWYVVDDGEFVLTEDTEVISGKTYFKKNDWTTIPTGGGSGSGHVIQDDGTAMTSRTNLNLIDHDISDDENNDGTKVKPHLLTSVEFEEIVSSAPQGIKSYIVRVIAENNVGDTVTLTNGIDTFTKTVSAEGIAEFAIVKPGTYTASISNEIIGSVMVGEYEIYESPNKVYGFHLDMTKSDPAQMISYNVQYNEKDVLNKNFNPVQMNLTTGIMDSGDWNLEDDFFIPRSCMLKYDGTVDYYLDEDDETKKADGTASDVANTSYGGNAMMEWGRDGQKIYLKIIPDTIPTNGATFYISNQKLDSDFHCWSFYDCDGNQIDHFYTPKYNGSNISSKLRSISGQVPCNSQTGANEVTYANANNVHNKVEWDTETWGDRTLINILLLMIGKSCNTQTVFGQGYTSGGSSTDSLATTGTLNGKGQWFGSSTSNDKTKGVKVFGMEHWWGNIWRRVRGLLNISGTVKYKFTYSQVDGTTQNGYDNTGSGYKTVANGTPDGTSGGYISVAVFNEDGIFAKTGSGSSTTYFCDGIWFNNSQSNYALVGGTCSSGSLCGAFYVNLTATFSTSIWYFGAAVSCKPLAA